MPQVSLFQTLEELNRVPRPFETTTTEMLWTDEHISRKVLEFHLDESIDVSSRNRGFVDKSIKWLISHFGLGPGRSVCDFGCGPGLYTTALARAGAEVTGIDFSPRSIEYARRTAAEAGLDIEYLNQDYLKFDTPRRFDLITLIFCDYCALSPAQRRTLLARFRELLGPGGAVVLDVFSLDFFAAAKAGTVYSRHPAGGFWSPKPHHVFQVSRKYREQKLTLDRYLILERDRTRDIFNWLQCFTPESIHRELSGSGLEVTEFYADVAGNPPREGSSEMAVVARKA